MYKQFSVILSLFILIGCEEVKLECDENNPTFSVCVQDVFNLNCTSSCHNNPTNAEGNLLLIDGLSYNQLYNIDSDNYSNYKRVDPYNPEISLLYIAIADAGNDVTLQMPPNGAVPSEQIEYIRKWIEQGALNN